MSATPHESSNGLIGRFQASGHPLKGGCGWFFAVYAQLLAIEAMMRGGCKSEIRLWAQNLSDLGGRTIENELYAQSSISTLIKLVAAKNRLF